MPLKNRVSHVLVTAILLCLAGCDANVERFPANELYGAVVSMRESRSIEPAGVDVSAVLEQLFGTPDKPRLPSEIPAQLISAENIARAAGPVSSDRAGVRFGLFRAQCVACHGIEGGGAGPAAAMQNPYPRDFRPAIFKFKSTSRGAKPTREDLIRLLHRGAPGTGMPSFSRLPEEDVEALVDYVIYLSIRGETERRLIDYAVVELGYGDGTLPPEQRLTLNESGEFDSASVAESVGSLITRIAQSWSAASEQVVPVPDANLKAALAGIQPDREAVERGRELFHGPLANCASCHGTDGSGEAVTLDFDDWTKEFSTRLGIAPNDAIALKPMRAAGALQPRPVKPRTVQWGVFRGGGDAATLHRRLTVGIDGTPMPGLLIQETAGPTGVTVDQVSDLVAYVQWLGLADRPESYPTVALRQESQ
jgi:mono/diheme cytochrome c family protein